MPVAVFRLSSVPCRDDDGGQCSPDVCNWDPFVHWFRVIAQPFRAYVCDAIQHREQSSLGWLVHLQ
jgi:hypothetical protein